MNEVFVFTGTLDCFTRKQAQQLVFALGSRVQQSVTKETTYLVVGKQPVMLFECFVFSYLKRTDRVT
ncbi:BRCT domain-containing protein [Enterococcus innesii]|uniref:BRCT domain-containing protein n=1 Tax=Enterococcus innesii TaxID=2839759 RepID=UPI0034A24D63